jgi:hypothetical protein
MAGLPRRSAKQRSERVGGSNSVVESQPSKLLVAGSIPVSRSSLRPPLGTVSRRAAACQASRDLAAARSAKADGLASQLAGEGCHAEAQRAKADLFEDRGLRPPM